MKPAITAIMFFGGLTCCVRHETRTSKGSDPPTVTLQSRNAHEPRTRRNVRDVGIISTKHLLPYVTDSTLDGNSHVWIWTVEGNGDLVHGLLFVHTSPDRDSGYAVYRVTDPNGDEERVRLSTDEAEAAIRDIEASLSKAGAKDRYDQYYAGDPLIQTYSEPGSNDPFADPQPDGKQTDTEASERESIENFNQSNLYRIAPLFRHYRKTAQGVQGADGNRPQAAQSPSKH